MDILGGIFESTGHSIIITIFVFSMMIIVDYINILSQGKIRGKLTRAKQYLLSSFLGSTPGCLGAFMSVSMYVHGIITFGALTACMIATSGDEAFVMLAMFPRDAIILFVILFIIGVFSGFIVDKIIDRFRIKVCEECILQRYHKENKEKMFSKKPNFSIGRSVLLSIFLLIITLNLLGLFGPKGTGVERITLLSISSFLIIVSVFSSDHYFREHIVDHIVKRHIWRIFLWTLGALIFVNVIVSLFNLDAVIQSNMNVILILSALVGLIPESGPHMIFVTMYFKGLIPFSVLLTSSIVQDGHGMLPLLSYTVRDSILMKTINLIIGLSIGLILYSLGL